MHFVFLLQTPKKTLLIYINDITEYTSFLRLYLSKIRVFWKFHKNEKEEMTSWQGNLIRPMNKWIHWHHRRDINRSPSLDNMKSKRGGWTLKKKWSTISPWSKHIEHKTESISLPTLVGIHPKLILQSNIFKLIGPRLFHLVKVSIPDTMLLFRILLARETEKSQEGSVDRP